MCAESSFEELLNLVEMNHQLACDPETGGCGKLNYIHHILSTPPHVFTTGDISLFLDLDFYFFSLDTKRKESEEIKVLWGYCFYTCSWSCSFGLAEYV